MKKKHLGSRFEDFLESEGILEECRASAIKFKLAHELEKAMNQQKISKVEMAKRLKTSRTGIDRLLDPDNTSITLNTMAKVAHLLGKRIDFAPEVNALALIPYGALCTAFDDVIVIVPHANTDKRGGEEQAQTAKCGGEIVAAS
ncbi:MAG: hypothetical protein ABSD28_00915 [Tepidisphaeraceae bacterium]|jgi:predicted XRE-type DNA-binding protein